MEKKKKLMSYNLIVTETPMSKALRTSLPAGCGLWHTPLTDKRFAVSRDTTRLILNVMWVMEMKINLTG